MMRTNRWSHDVRRERVASSLQPCPGKETSVLAAIGIFLVKYMMSALMLAIGLATSIAALRATWAERRMVWKALLVLELGVPLLALVTVLLLPVGPRAVGIIAIMAVCPGAPIILRKVKERPVVLVIVALISLLAPITLTAWVAILDRVLPHELSVRPGAIAQITLLKQVLPLAIGMGIAAALPRAAALLERVAWGVFFAGFALALALVLYKGAPALVQASPIALVAAGIVVLGSAVMGLLAGRPRPDDEKALSTIAVLGNPALATAVIAQSYPGFKAGALMAAYLILRALALLVYTLVVRQWSKRRVPRGSTDRTGNRARDRASGSRDRRRQRSVPVPP
jgi:BASS family bile acid:Na+ symporter